MSRRDEQREFEGDVYYEAWRRRINPDRISPECIDDCFWNSRQPDECVDEYQRRVRDRRERAELEQLKCEQQQDEP